MDGRIKKYEKENDLRRIQNVLKRDRNTNFYIGVKRTVIQNKYIFLYFLPRCAIVHLLLSLSCTLNNVIINKFVQ